MILNRRRLLLGSTALVLVAAFDTPARAQMPLPPLASGDDPGIGWPKHDLLRPVAANSLDARLLAKPVLRSRALGAGDGRWSATPTAAVTTMSAQGEPETVRLTSPMLNAAYLKESRAPNGSSNGGAGYLVEGAGANFWRLTMSAQQDWSSFNRIAFDLFVHDTGFDAYAIGLGLVDAAAPPLGPTGPLPFTFIHDLVAGRWNRVVWEIPQLQRGRIVEFAVFQPLRGPVGQVRYDMRDLALQQVAPEVIEGWEVAPGRIAYNHVGYTPGATKIALAGGPPVESFDLMDARTGRVVESFAAKQQETRIGRFQRLDFTTFTRPGRYRIRAGTLEGRDFEIRDDLWIGVVGKLLNFFYADRCGYAVPGIHPVCHRDLRGEHEGVTRPLNGGWHDAGNGAQGSYRTSLCTEGLLAVLARLRTRPEQAGLAARVREEASWGLDWLLRTRFGKGYRVTDVGFSIYTDGRLGNDDDIVRSATLDPFENLLFVSVAADAARLLKHEDPARSALALAAALDDYAATMTALPAARPRIAERNSPAPFQQYAYGALAALALYRATGRSALLDDGVAFGARLLACQDTQPIGETRITGFFYEDEQHRMPSHELHTSFADAAPRALAGLCDLMPRHARAPAWRAALALHAKAYLSEGSRFSAPYDHVPNAVWRDEQFARFVEDTIAGLRHFPPGIGYKYIPAVDEQAMRTGYAREYAAAVSLADGVRLRTFPVPPDPVFHGETNIQIATAAGLLSAAEALSDQPLRRLAERQLDWVFGANPFSNCLMYGEGYDFSAQFQAIARNMVGSLPVGMDNRLDRPFWPTANHFTSKEMWVVPAGHMLKVLASLLPGDPMPKTS